MNVRTQKSLRDGLLAILVFVLIVSIYMFIDRSRSRFGDWNAGPICRVLHGQVQFAFRPFLTVNLGSYREVIFFKDSTVVHCGGTYLDFGMNGVLLIGAVAGLGVITGIVSEFGHKKMKKD
jgi:hypothetical protein